ncbi:hypothetical protein ACFSR7_36175 [Cohnella sp. GCM10020058]|uniref:hypothetical protein n=1 Tax=Cohnella sp. GCM10020058 TaxID=3317330 RepID=UPI0036250D6C
MKVTNVWKLEADPTQPVVEVRNLIVAYLRTHPGSEVKILEAIRDEVSVAIEQFQQPPTKAAAPTPARAPHFRNPRKKQRPNRR